MENSPIENQINSTSPSIPICNKEQCQTDVPNFTISHEKLAKLVESLEANDIHEIAAALETNIDAGISGDTRDLLRRHKAFGSNLSFDDQPSIVIKGFNQLLLEAYKDTTITLLLCCATLSLVIGIRRNGPREGFQDGAIIFLAIFIVVNFGVICRFFKGWRMRKLSRGKRLVRVMRGGKIQQIPVSEVVVGDVLCLKTGYSVPVDGLLITGDSFNLDDGSGIDKHSSVFTGAKVVRGDCRMLVTSVGKHTEKSRLMRSVSCHEESKLQISIDKMNSGMEKICLCLTLLVLVVQVMRCFVWKSCCDDNHNPDPKGVKSTVEEIMNETAKLMKKQGARVNNRLVAMLCVLLFSIRDSLPLGISLSFSYAAKKMSFLGAMVRKLPACATIGLVTTVCTGKTTDLALQHSKMAELWIGLDIIEEIHTGVVNEVLNFLREGVGMNLYGQADYAVLLWAQEVLGVNQEELYQNRTIEAFDLEMNRRGLSLRRNGVVDVHWKGDPNKVLSMCSHYYEADGTMQTLDEQKRAMFNNIIERFSSDSFAFAHKQVVIQENERQDDEEVVKPVEHGLTLLGMVRLKNPYEPEVIRAVKACRESGVEVKLVVADDINTARFMAVNSGIIKVEDAFKGTVIKASEFRHSSEEHRMKMTDHIRVMTNSSPSDQLLLLQCLKQKGEVIAVTGISTRDSPSLKEADVGLFVGGDAVEAAMEDSDIIVLDRNFITIPLILNFGRWVFNSLQKIAQLHLTLNVAAFAVNFIVVLSNCDNPVGPFELFWVNLIMDILVALALAEPPQHASENGQPIQKPAQIITRTVWRDVVVQILYQVSVLLGLYFKGKCFLHIDQRVVKTMIFNCYVLCQVFVLISAREIEKMVLLKLKNWWFLVGAIIVLQVAMMEIMVVVTHEERLDLKQWCFCVGIAALSLPLGWVAKWVSSTSINHLSHFLIHFFVSYSSHIFTWLKSKAKRVWNI